jgi:anti-sigma factor RsiW
MPGLRPGAPIASKTWRGTIAENATRYTAPTQTPPEASAPRSPPHPPTASRIIRFRHPIRIAAALLIAASLAWFAVTRPPNRTNDALARELVAAHVRSLQADHLLDVPSSDQHTVKPWFSG